MDRETHGHQPTDETTHDALELLLHGRIEVEGRLTEASNTTLLCSISTNGVEERCVYKPVRGERPLWDFPDGTLAGREVATFLVSEAAGFRVVPPTVLRDGPFGPGMVQRWIETDDERELVDILAPKDVDENWRTVLRARGMDGDPALLVHADDPALRRMAALDVVVNNADRKGGHVLAGIDGGVYGVDHGVSLHAEDKLRTVLWGWLGEALSEEERDGVGRVLEGLAGELGRGLAGLLSAEEVDALAERCARLLDDGIFPAQIGRAHV